MLVTTMKEVWKWLKSNENNLYKPRKKEQIIDHQIKFITETNRSSYGKAEQNLNISIMNETCKTWWIIYELEHWQRKVKLHKNLAPRKVILCVLCTYFCGISGNFKLFSHFTQIKNSGKRIFQKTLKPSISYFTKIQ